MNIFTPYLIPGIALVLTLASGFWLSSLGRPYRTAIFNVHKLIALGAVIAAAVQFVGALRAAPPQALAGAALAVAGVCVVALFASGAFLSLNNPNYALLLAIHRVAPALAVAALALAVWLLTRRPL